ncbi:hypothetical protein NDU88_007025 [Pleurodeles waltl]|uniref:Uncharacterized protein n=1 Tax=Pleurodeles waltl TaxID=8319 RepID=A0AAV7NRX6_PLEWA|nr:hypothetical protein NDU88_007025 [Pleurodeles waltl]
MVNFCTVLGDRTTVLSVSDRNFVETQSAPAPPCLAVALTVSCVEATPHTVERPSRRPGSPHRPLLPRSLSICLSHPASNTLKYTRNYIYCFARVGDPLFIYKNRLESQDETKTRRD